MFNHGNERLKLDDSFIDIINNMSGGNPGAINVVMKIIEKGHLIDGKDFMGVVLSLDSHGIWESRIWLLFKDVCKEHLSTMIAVLRACQLGKFSSEVLDNMIDGTFEGNIKETVCQMLVDVKERLGDDFDMDFESLNLFLKSEDG